MTILGEIQPALSNFLTLICHFLRLKALLHTASFVHLVTSFTGGRLFRGLEEIIVKTIPLSATTHSLHIVIGKKGKLGANAMKRVAAGADLPTPWLFEPAKSPDDKTDYCLGCSFLPQCKHQVLVFTLERAVVRPMGEQW